MKGGPPPAMGTWRSSTTSVATKPVRRSEVYDKRNDELDTTTSSSNPGGGGAAKNNRKSTSR